MKCPACAVDMTEGQRCGATMQSCPECGACWTTRGSLQAAIEGIERRFTAAVLATLRAEVAERRRAGPTGPAASKVSYRKCPACGVQMHRKAFAPVSGILAEVCTVHGFLFGVGQLEAVADHVARGGEVLALEESNRRLADELAELRRKVTGTEQTKAQEAGGMGVFFVG